MSFRLPFRLFGLPVLLVNLAAVSALAQATTGQKDQQQQQFPAGHIPIGQTPADQTLTPATPPPAPAGPDYPDPRTLTLGAFYWLTNLGLGTNLSVYNGQGATSEEALPNFGKPHNTPDIEASYPVTRTGMLYVEVFEAKGTGNEPSPLTTFPLGVSTAITKGDYLATQYQTKDFHIYLDDLLFPHKFPVSRLRFKSLWGFEYFSTKPTVTNPLVATPVVASDTRNIYAPTFGLAAEYALSKHVLLRVSAAGWGMYHRADIGEAAGQLTWRRGPAELVLGEKLLHYKSSPKNSAGYVAGTMIGAFAGLRWHF